MPARQLGTRDLMYIVLDLEFVQGACDRLLALPPDASWIEKYSLWISAVVVYVRCWARTQRDGRAPLPTALLDQLNEHDQATHKRTWQERDRYQAHAEFTRDTVISVERVSRAATNEVVGHQVGLRRFTHDPDQVRELGALARAVRELVAPLIDEGLRAIEV